MAINKIKTIEPKQLELPVEPSTTTLYLAPDLHAMQIDQDSPMPLSLLKIGSITPSLGLLPPVVKYISPINDENMSVAIVESAPRKQTLHIAGQKPISIQLPWIHWLFIFTGHSAKDLSLVKITNVGIAFSTSQLKKHDHKFYHPYLSNTLGYIDMFLTDDIYSLTCFPFSEICFGELLPKHFFDQVLNVDISFDQAFMDVTRAFFQTTFNFEGESNLIDYMVDELVSTDDETHCNEIRCEIEEIVWNDREEFQELMYEYYKSKSEMTVDDAIALLINGSHCKAEQGDFQAIFDLLEKPKGFSVENLLRTLKFTSMLVDTPKIGSAGDLSEQKISKLAKFVMTAEIANEIINCDREDECPPYHLDENGDHKG